MALVRGIRKGLDDWYARVLNKKLSSVDDERARKLDVFFEFIRDQKLDQVLISGRENSVEEIGSDREVPEIIFFEKMSRLLRAAHSLCQESADRKKKKKKNY